MGIDIDIESQAISNYPCSSCGADVGDACRTVTGSGRKTGPHAARRGPLDLAYMQEWRHGRIAGIYYASHRVRDESPSIADWLDKIAAAQRSGDPR